MSSFMTHTTRAAEIDVPTTMRSASRLPSSITLRSAEGLAVIGRVTHKIEHPGTVHRLDVTQVLGWPGSDALLGAALHVELHLAIHPMDSFIVKGTATQTQTIRVLPKAPSGALGHNRIARINHLPVSFEPIYPCLIQHRS